MDVWESGLFPVGWALAGRSQPLLRSGYPEPGLYALDFDSLTTRRILSDDWVDYPALSPDGRQIAYISANRDIWVASLEDGEKELVLQDTMWLRELMWLPDASSIAYVRNSAHFDGRKEGGVWLFNLETRHSERLTYTAPGWFDINPLNGTVVYSADTLSIESLHQRIFVKKAGDEEATAVADGEVPRFTADGRQIYFLSTSLPNGPDSIFVSSLDGSNLRVLYSGSQIEAVPLLIDEGRSLFVRTYDTLLRASLSTGSTSVLARAEHHGIPEEETGERYARRRPGGTSRQPHLLFRHQAIFRRRLLTTHCMSALRYDKDPIILIRSRRAAPPPASIPHHPARSSHSRPHR